jgi:hypothetical protein
MHQKFKKQMEEVISEFKYVKLPKAALIQSNPNPYATPGDGMPLTPMSGI